MNADENHVRVRPDLKWQRAEWGTNDVWIAKDPFANEYFYLSHRERSLLMLADGKRSLSEITQRCKTLYAPEDVSPESLVDFFAEALRSGLLIASESVGDKDERGLAYEKHGSTHHATPAASSPRRWWHQLLAIRLPGVSVDRQIDRLMPLVRTILSLPVRLAAVIFTFIMALASMMYFDQIAKHLDTVTHQPVTDWGVPLIAVIFVLKVLHEIAHAVTCKWFGAECRQIGVMLLFGMPVLYCDVSDAWLLKQRWKRIMVSSAGMMAELFVAAVAMLMWLLLGDSLLRDLCVTVMFVGSVSTVVFNGNPLLRYDGYYILADWVGVPNLARQASVSVQTWLRRMIWNDALSDARVESASRFGSRISPVRLRMYWTASLLYRGLVYATLGMWVYRKADQVELGAIIAISLLLVLMLGVVPWLRVVLSPPPSRRRNRSELLRRPPAIGAIAALVIATLLWTPLPHQIKAPMTIRVAESQPIVATTAGRIVDGIPEGSVVKQGDIIAKLTNPDLMLTIAEDQTKLNALQTELASLQSVRPATRQILDRIAVVSESIEANQHQLQLLVSQASQLEIVAPAPGVVFPAVHRVQNVGHARELRTWDRTPLTMRNRGAWIEAGTRLGTLGTAGQYDAIALVRQQDLRYVREGQSVSLMLNHVSPGAFRGKVVEVASSSTDGIPDELVSKRMVMPVGRGNGPSDAYYQVRVRLHPSNQPLAMRSTGYAKIDVPWTSLWNRWSTTLRDAF
ncbi:peptidase, M50 family [Rhodopirellula maiorica SM1]|uniref:Peptidase, M50 family n=1 Tax=Rhodopirellula maiorica SM1 TaxID=1265738 RepID=M5RVS9_9BACT|nr:site-2 protease family protein [Rhodopirellula maiorica]EMI19502.1 peptidase, M50 family [Rhodopirellula maiorica SM1]